VLDEIPAPGHPAAGHLLVRSEAVGICGSDLHILEGDTGALSGVPDFYPRVQGHEISAVIERAGGGCYPCRENRPNVCVNPRLIGVHLDGGLRELLEIPAANAFAAPGLDPGCTAFVEPMSIVVHALRRAGPAARRAGDHLRRGPDRPGRRDRRSPRGQPIADPRRDRQHQRPSASGEHGKPGRADRGGQHVGRHDGATPGDLPGKGDRRPRLELRDLGGQADRASAEAIRLVTAHADAVTTLLTHRFPLRRVAEAFDLAARRPDDAVKILIMT
jgi:threonine dehydrogenase-like Zn-dependent dehydrogenase